MNVILLTMFLGLILVSLAIVFFFYARMASQGSSPERDSLLPLEDDFPPTSPSANQTDKK